MSKDMALPEKLQHCPVIIEFPVAWGEMDAYQHVNNVTYFRYFESARIAYFDEVGVNEFMAESNIGPILASTQCRFKAPLTYPDQLSVGTEIVEMGSDQFTMKYYVMSHKSGRIVAEGEGLIVYYDYNQNCRTDIPAQLRANMEAIVK